MKTLISLLVFCASLALSQSVTFAAPSSRDDSEREKASSEIFVWSNRVLEESKWTPKTWKSAAFLLADPKTDYETKKSIVYIAYRFSKSVWPAEFFAVYQASIPALSMQAFEVERYKYLAEDFRKVANVAVFSQSEWTSEIWNMLGEVALDQLPRHQSSVGAGKTVFSRLKYARGATGWPLAVQQFLNETVPLEQGPGTDGFWEAIKDTPLATTKIKDFTAETVWNLISRDLAANDFAALAPHISRWRNIPDVFRNEIVDRISRPLDPINFTLVQYAFHFRPILKDELIFQTYEKVLSHFQDVRDGRNLKQLLEDPVAREIVSLQWIILDKVARQGFGYKGTKELPESFIRAMTNLEATWGRALLPSQADLKIAGIRTPLGSTVAVAPDRISRVLRNLLERQQYLQPHIATCENIFAPSMF